MQVLFAVDEAAALLYETGFRKAGSLLTVADKDNVKSVLVDYHCMLKVKACMDQFAGGLQELNVIAKMDQYPNIMKPLLVDEPKVLTAGMLFY